MPTQFKTPWIFLPFSVLCAFLYARGPDESLLLGVLYSSALTLRLPPRISARQAFPLVMLFLFLLVLAEAPPHPFTVSLAYTVRALIVFRGLIVSLSHIQTSKAETPRNQLTWTLGLSFEFLISAIFVYSTFRPVALTVFEVGHILIGGVFMILASVLTPFWMVGVGLGLLSFSPITRVWSIMGFGLLAVYESNFSKRARSATP